MPNYLSYLEEAVCQGCHQAGWASPPDGVALQQYWYHPSCVPTCHSCTMQLTVEEEERWIYEAAVVSVAWGYTVEPTRYWCRECWDAAPRDEPPALD